MAKITYEDKVTMEVNESIPNVYKVTSSDMNEIKDVVNANAKSVDVGSVIITNTNVNPSEEIGGTWKLIDKEFENARLEDNSFFNANSTNATVTNVYVTRSGHMLQIRLGLQNKVALSDTAVVLGSFNFNKLGISRLHFTTFYDVLHSDAGNGSVFGYVDWNTGEYSTSDVIGTDSIAANSQFYGIFNFVMIYDYMLDSVCNKFYWERVA